MDEATRSALKNLQLRTQVTHKPSVEPPTLHRSGINRWETPDRSTIQRGIRGNVHSHEYRGQQGKENTVLRDGEQGLRGFADARLKIHQTVQTHTDDPKARGHYAAMAEDIKRDMAKCAEWAKGRHPNPPTQPDLQKAQTQAQSQEQRPER